MVGTADAALALAQRIATEVYPTMSDEYRSSECRAGGALDLTPGDVRWP